MHSQYCAMFIEKISGISVCTIQTHVVQELSAVFFNTNIFLKIASVGK